jgi:hypothetical protein
VAAAPVPAQPHGDGFLGTQGALGLIKPRFYQIHPRARTLVGVEQFDGDGFPIEDFGGDKGHALGTQHANQTAVFIVAR